MSNVVRYDYCPVCFNKASYEIDEGTKGDWHPGGKNLYPICRECGWKGTWDDVIDEAEAKNYKRIKIIDRSLNETK
jgi:hypothetical protein